jgi:hypothetical protein
MTPAFSEGVYSMQWRGNPPGELYTFSGKEGTLTYADVHPGDEFDFWKYPEGMSLEEARRYGISVASYIGYSTVNEWIAGQQQASCTPHVEKNSDEGGKCPACQGLPEVCENITEGKDGIIAHIANGYLVVANRSFDAATSDWGNRTGHYWIYFSTEKPNVDGLSLVDYDDQCTQCATWAWMYKDGQISYYYGIGSTIYGLTPIIQQTEGLDYEAAHQKAIRISRQFAGRPDKTGWFGFFDGGQ